MSAHDTNIGELSKKLKQNRRNNNVFLAVLFFGAFVWYAYSMHVVNHLETELELQAENMRLRDSVYTLHDKIYHLQDTLINHKSQISTLRLQLIDSEKIIYKLKNKGNGRINDNSAILQQLLKDEMEARIKLEQQIEYLEKQRQTQRKVLAGVLDKLKQPRPDVQEVLSAIEELRSNLSSNRLEGLIDVAEVHVEIVELFSRNKGKTASVVIEIDGNEHVSGNFLLGLQVFDEVNRTYVSLHDNYRPEIALAICTKNTSRRKFELKNEKSMTFSDARSLTYKFYIHDTKVRSETWQDGQMNTSSDLSN